MSRPTLHAAYRTVRVNVTEDIIAAAMPHDSAHCMIADAVKAALPTARTIAVDLATIRFTDPDKSSRYIYLSPGHVQTALLRFDQGLPVQPFEFTLRAAAQVVRTGKNYAKAGGRKRAGVATTRSTKVPTRLGGSAPANAVLTNRGRTRRFGLRSATP